MRVFLSVVCCMMLSVQAVDIGFAVYVDSDCTQTLRAGANPDVASGLVSVNQDQCYTLSYTSPLDGHLQTNSYSNFNCGENYVMWTHEPGSADCGVGSKVLIDKLYSDRCTPVASHMGTTYVKLINFPGCDAKYDYPEDTKFSAETHGTGTFATQIGAPASTTGGFSASVTSSDQGQTQSGTKKSKFGGKFLKIKKGVSVGATPFEDARFSNDETSEESETPTDEKDGKKGFSNGGFDGEFARMTDDETSEESETPTDDEKDGKKDGKKGDGGFDGEIARISDDETSEEAETPADSDEKGDSNGGFEDPEFEETSEEEHDDKKGKKGKKGDHDHDQLDFSLEFGESLEGSGEEDTELENARVSASSEEYDYGTYDYDADYSDYYGYYGDYGSNQNSAEYDYSNYDYLQ